MIGGDCGVMASFVYSGLLRPGQSSDPISYSATVYMNRNSSIHKITVPTRIPEYQTRRADWTIHCCTTIAPVMFASA